MARETVRIALTASVVLSKKSEFQAMALIPLQPSLMFSQNQSLVVPSLYACRNQYSLPRGDGAKNSLVAIQWLPDDFVYAL
jgi:hypothetical protein